MVIIYNENEAREHWHLGRIVGLMPNDHHPRTALLHVGTSGRMWKRAINHLFPLEIGGDDALISLPNEQPNIPPPTVNVFKLINLENMTNRDEEISLYDDQSDMDELDEVTIEPDIEVVVQASSEPSQNVPKNENINCVGLVSQTPKVGEGLKKGAKNGPKNKGGSKKFQKGGINKRTQNTAFKKPFPLNRIPKPAFETPTPLNQVKFTPAFLRWVKHKKSTPKQKFIPGNVHINPHFLLSLLTRRTPVLLMILGCLTFLMGTARAVDPMVCHTHIPGKIIKIDPSSSCVNYSFDAGMSPVNTTLKIFQPNLELVQISAGLCTTVLHTTSYWKNLIFERRDNTQQSMLPTSQLECLKMLRTHKCHWGPLIEMKGGVYRTENKLERDYSYFSTKTDSKTNCLLTETIVSIAPGTQKLYSPIADISRCQYEDGACVLEEGAIIAWERNKTMEHTNFCSYTPLETKAGTLYNNIWVDGAREFAISFTSSPTPTTNSCGEQLYLFDQGYALGSTEYSQHFSKSKREKRERAYVSPNQLAAQLTAAEFANYQDLRVSVEHMLNLICTEFAKIPSSLTNANPTALIRKIFNNDYLQARKFGRDYFEIWNCWPVPLSGITFVASQLSPGSTGCFKYAPINFTMTGYQSQSGYLNPETMIIAGISEKGPCSTHRHLSVELETKIYRIDQLTGHVTPLSPSDIQLAKLASFKPDFPTLTPHTFHSLVLTETEDPQVKMYEALKFYRSANLLSKETVPQISLPQNTASVPTPSWSWHWPHISMHDIWINSCGIFVTIFIIVHYIIPFLVDKFVRPYLAPLAPRPRVNFRRNATPLPEIELTELRETDIEPAPKERSATIRSLTSRWNQMMNRRG